MSLVQGRGMLTSLSCTAKSHGVVPNLDGMNIDHTQFTKQSKDVDLRDEQHRLPGGREYEFENRGLCSSGGKITQARTYLLGIFSNMDVSFLELLSIWHED